jgi:hypothetical protein
MKTIQAPSGRSTFFEEFAIHLEVDPGMAFAVALAAGIFAAGFLATLALRKGWL